MEFQYWWAFGFVAGVAAVLVVQNIIRYLDNHS